MSVMEVLAPRLKVPNITEESLEKGERLAHWLNQLRQVPKGVKLVAAFSVEILLDYNDDDGGQCAFIIPGVPLPVERIRWDHSGSGGRQETHQVLPPVTEPVAVRSFDFGSNFYYDQDETGSVPIKAESVVWVPDPANWGIQLREIYSYDPSAHRLAVFDNWDHPQVVM